MYLGNLDLEIKIFNGPLKEQFAETTKEERLFLNMLGKLTSYLAIIKSLITYATIICLIYTNMSSS